MFIKTESCISTLTDNAVPVATIRMLQTVACLVWISFVVLQCEGRPSCPASLQSTGSNDHVGHIVYPKDSDDFTIGPLDCDITLTSQAQKIRISFSKLLIPCHKGTLLVFAPDGRKLRSYCGTSLPSPQEFHRSSIRLQLQFRNKSGIRFRLEHEYIGIPSNPKTLCEPRMLHEEKSADGRSGVITLVRIRGKTESCPIRIAGKHGSKKTGVALVINELDLGAADCKETALVITRDQLHKPELLCGFKTNESRLYDDWLTLQVRVSNRALAPVLQLRYIILLEDIMTTLKNPREVDVCQHGRCHRFYKPLEDDAVSTRWTHNEPDCGVALEPIPPFKLSKIVGGEEAPSGTWPWIGSLFIKSPFAPFCGASLIKPDWMLTAAHCIRGAEDRGLITADDYSSIGVRLGIHDLHENSDSTSTVQTVDVDKIIVHPGYSPAVSLNHNNDIALIKLTSKVDYTDAVKPICLPAKSSKLLQDTYLTVAGWGEDYNESTIEGAQLQYVWLQAMDQQMCKDIYSDRFTENMFCAGYKVGGKDSCQGDSGGPMIMAVPQNAAIPIYIQMGVVSWGESCALPDRPGVYTRVSNYVDWIEQMINNNE